MGFSWEHEHNFNKGWCLLCGCREDAVYNKIKSGGLDE